jgi:catechol 2,3-dioxygenase-like lactoylglutathione lyase family enzyme
MGGEMLGAAVIQAMVGTARPEAAKTFYGQTLGLKLISEDSYALLFAGKIGFLRVVKLPAVMPASAAVLTFAVEDAAATVKDLSGKGVRFERIAFLQQDELGVWAAPNGAKVAWFRDPDLNLLSLTQDA